MRRRTLTTPHAKPGLKKSPSYGTTRAADNGMKGPRGQKDIPENQQTSTMRNTKTNTKNAKGDVQKKEALQRRNCTHQQKPRRLEPHVAHSLECARAHALRASPGSRTLAKTEKDRISCCATPSACREWRHGCPCCAPRRQCHSKRRFRSDRSTHEPNKACTQKYGYMSSRSSPTHVTYTTRSIGVEG